jgi:hypothetical protein
MHSIGTKMVWFLTKWPLGMIAFGLLLTIAWIAVLIWLASFLLPSL